MNLFTMLLVLLLANVVADDLCRRFAPRPWAKALCVGTIVLDTLFLIPVLKAMLDLSPQKVDGVGGIIVLPGLLLVGATLWFVYVYRSRFFRRAPPP